jgi:polysaccharide biosynthesis transport protein
MNVGFPLPAKIDQESAVPRFDLRQYVNFLWRHWIFIGATAAFALAIGLIYLARATPLYIATTQVLLEPRRERAPGGDSVLSDIQLEDASTIESQLAIIKSDSLLEHVVVKEKLVSPPTDATKNAQSPGEPAEDTNLLKARLVQEAINRLRDALTISRSGQAYVINISVTWNDPKKAAVLANAVADAYVVDQLDAGFDAAKRASAWLSDRLVELREQLRISEEAVAKFRAEHGLARTGGNVTLNEQQVAELNNKLMAARTDAAEKKTRVDYLADVAAGKRTLQSLPDSFQSAGQSGVIGTLRQRLAEASQREADLLARYSDRHPMVVNVQAEKRDIERSIAVETQRMIEAVKSEYALAKAREVATEQAFREATGQGGLDSEDAVKLRELERTATVNKSLFEDFLQRAKITDEKSTFRARNARIITPAQPPGSPSFPRTRIILAVTLFVGIASGVGGAIAMEMLNSGFTTSREVEELLAVPVLASIAKMDSRKLTKDGTEIAVPLYQVHYPLSPFSEAIRTLRSGIHMSDVDRPPKVIHVTSARPGEGKTTIAISLAISAASSNLRVVLIDADLRHPSASRFFGLEKEKGLVDLLTGAAQEDHLMFQKDRVLVIPAGSKSLNPPDILGSERMKALINHLKETCDYVVIDSPPVGPVVDASIVARQADKTVFVVQWASTPREVVETCLQKVSIDKRVGGIVLNLLNQDRAKKYGPEYGSQYYAGYYSE